MATSPRHIDPSTYLDDLLTQASPDLMRRMLQSFINEDSVHPGRPDLRRGVRHHRRVAHQHPQRLVDTATSTPALAPSTSPFPSSAPVRSSPTGCWNDAAAPNAL